MVGWPLLWIWCPLFFFLIAETFLEIKILKECCFISGRVFGFTGLDIINFFCFFKVTKLIMVFTRGSITFALFVFVQEH